MRKWLSLILISLLFMSGCSANNTKEEKANLLDKDWSQVVKEARGTTVNFYMWGGDERINTWVDHYVAENMEEQYGVKVNRVPMDAAEFVNKLLSEKQVNKEEGTMDLLWINGENFRTVREGDMLWGPFADKLPNYNQYVDKNAPDVERDFGFPVEGYEVPYGKAQFVFAVDSDRVGNPPKSSAELLNWAKKNRGKFTYPELPDFTGSVFVRHLMYELCGGYQAFPAIAKGQTIDKAKLNQQLEPLWAYCNEIKPYLWRKGETYPANIAELDKLFADGEVDMTMTYQPATISGRIDQGLLPETVRNLVWEKGTIGNTHFMAVPFNANNKAGAMVLANFLMSPEAQLSKYEPKNWGDMPALDVKKLEQEYVDQLNKVDQGVASLSTEEMLNHRLPEIDSGYIPVIEKLWKENVLSK